MGKLIGKREVLEELESLASLDNNTRLYIKARLKSLDEVDSILRNYKLCQ